MKKILLGLGIVFTAIFCHADKIKNELKQSLKEIPENSRIVFATFCRELMSGYQLAAEDFEKETGIKVDVTAVPYNNFITWMRCQYLSKQPPAVLLMEQVNEVRDYGHAGMLYKFDNALNAPNPFFPDNCNPWKATFTGNIITVNYDYDGHCYLIPFSQFGIGFFYDVDKYKKYNLSVPKTWNDFINNCKILKENGETPIVTSITKNDAQIVAWTIGVFYDSLMRHYIPKVNIEHEKGWKYDPEELNNTLNERIDLSENIIGFERGYLDPAKAPEFKEIFKLMKNYSKYWREDYMSLDGELVYEAFAKREMVHMLMGTWYFERLTQLQNTFKEIKPELVFQYSTFPFPEITSETVNSPLTGRVAQMSAKRYFLVIPVQILKQNKWKEKAALLFTQYVTSPKVMQKIFDNSQSYDLPAVKGVKPFKVAEPLMPKNQPATMVIGAVNGYDKMGLDQFNIYFQEYFTNRINLDEFCKKLSRSQRESLLRISKMQPDSINQELIKKELGKEFK